MYFRRALLVILCLAALALYRADRATAELAGRPPLRVTLALQPFAIEGSTVRVGSLALPTLIRLR